MNTVANTAGESFGLGTQCWYNGAPADVVEVNATTGMVTIVERVAVTGGKAPRYQVWADELSLERERKQPIPLVDETPLMPDSTHADAIGDGDDLDDEDETEDPEGEDEPEIATMSVSPTPADIPKRKPVASKK